MANESHFEFILPSQSVAYPLIGDGNLTIIALPCPGCIKFLSSLWGRRAWCICAIGACGLFGMGVGIVFKSAVWISRGTLGLLKDLIKGSVKDKKGNN